MAQKLAPTKKIAEIYLPYLPLFASLLSLVVHSIVANTGFGIVALVHNDRGGQGRPEHTHQQTIIEGA